MVGSSSARKAEEVVARDRRETTDDELREVKDAVLAAVREREKGRTEAT
jgi:hypothetical protein